MYRTLYIAPDLDTNFSALSSSNPRSGTTFDDGATFTPADSLEPEIPGVPYNYAAGSVGWSINIPAGGSVPVEIQAVLVNGINGETGTPTWSVNTRLAAAPSSLTRLQGLTFVFDSPVVVPVENSVSIVGQAKAAWDPPQGFLDEFPGWVRPT